MTKRVKCRIRRCRLASLELHRSLNPRFLKDLFKSTTDPPAFVTQIPLRHHWKHIITPLTIFSFALCAPHSALIQRFSKRRMDGDRDRMTLQMLARLARNELDDAAIFLHITPTKSTAIPKPLPGINPQQEQQLPFSGSANLGRFELCRPRS